MVVKTELKTQSLIHGRCKKTFTISYSAGLEGVFEYYCVCSEAVIVSLLPCVSCKGEITLGLNPNTFKHHCLSCHLITSIPENYHKIIEENNKVVEKLTQKEQDKAKEQEELERKPAKVKPAKFWWRMVRDIWTKKPCYTPISINCPGCDQDALFLNEIEVTCANCENMYKIELKK